MTGLTPDDASETASGTRDREMRAIELPTRIVDEVERRVERTDFDSVASYVAFVLEETLARIDDPGDEGSDAVTEEQVRSRLESLGYLE